MTNNESLIDQIIELELEMFLRVPTQQKSSCQDHPDSFCLHRRAQFVAWSQRTLESYLADLRRAVVAGDNLLTHKYVRMDNLLARENHSPLVEQLATVMLRWQREFIERYPRMMASGRPLCSTEDTPCSTSFETYLKGELESYSARTLQCLSEDVADYQLRQASMSDVTYDYLVKQWGFESVEQLNQRLGACLSAPDRTLSD
ncbi:MAG: DUF4125 family protein [Desulfuromonas sp.]|nr:DUF4125 family protein [Desulfuromonas sp.]